MNIRFFYHSLVSDWNHGNAHFLRGVLSELASRGHDVLVFEPADSWSRTQLINEYGPSAIDDFDVHYPGLRSLQYQSDQLNLDEWLDGVNLVLVHEWTAANVVAAIGRYRCTHRDVRVFFHDTHHRAVTAPHEIEATRLADYDGVLAYGRTLRDLYLAQGWSRNVYVWHEAADRRVFFPRPQSETLHDVVWIGNWGDEERTAELDEYLLTPIRELHLRGNVYGVRYPEAALGRLAGSGLRYCGWTPNYKVPEIFARHRLTVHIPRRPYVRSLPGIPTIRPFEALSCGIPLVSAPWEDVEGLFRTCEDMLIARNGIEMRSMIAEVCNDPALASSLAKNGLETIARRHTCAHRVDELLAIYETQISREQLTEIGVGTD